MEDLQSETDSDYTSYWKDWVSCFYYSSFDIQISLLGIILVLYEEEKVCCIQSGCDKWTFDSQYSSYTKTAHSDSIASTPK